MTSSNGVNVRLPCGHAPPSYQVPLIHSSIKNGQDPAYTAFQELACQYVVEQTESTINPILMKANKHQYHAVHRFLQRYMKRKQYHCAKRKRDIPKVHVLPELSKLPTVGVVSGTDATFSDVWMKPLMHVIHRSFPLILVIPEKINDVREMVEWLVQCMEAVLDMKQQEQRWLSTQIDHFQEFMRVHGKSNEVKGEEEAQSLDFPVEKRVLRPRLGRIVVEKDMLDNFDDIDFIPSESNSEDEDDVDMDTEDDEDRTITSRKSKNNMHFSNRRHVFHDLLTDELLTIFSNTLNKVEQCTDPCAIELSILRELVMDNVAYEIESSRDLDETIEYFDTLILWLKKRMNGFRTAMTYKDETRRFVSRIRVATGLYGWACLVQQVLQSFLTFLKTYQSSIDNQKQKIKQWITTSEMDLMRYEDIYQLHNLSLADQQEIETHLISFPLLCIERLDNFNTKALRDFIDVWVRYTSCSVQSIQKNYFSSRLGFIWGISTPTSRALRTLGLPTVRRVDIQFFSLNDTHRQMDRILHTLVVDGRYPLSISGDILRFIQTRHATSQSKTTLIQVLTVIARHHFETQRWSFLSHFAFEKHCNKPLSRVTNRSDYANTWIQENPMKESTLRAYIDKLSTATREELKELVVGATDTGSDDWILVLEQELMWVQRQWLQWTVGWRCLHSTSLHFGLQDRGETYEEWMVMALDGTIRKSIKVKLIRTWLEGKDSTMVLYVLKEWREITLALRDKRVTQIVSDLIDLCDELLIMGDTAWDMRACVRVEVCEFMDDHILPLMDPIKSEAGSLRANIVTWSRVSKVHGLGARLTLRTSEALVQTMDNLNDEEFCHGTAASDVNLAFMYFLKNPGLYLCLSTWYTAFAEAVEAERGRGSLDYDLDATNLSARFTRAIATLRRWGYIKGPEGIRRNAHLRGADTFVEKQIFLAD